MSNRGNYARAKTALDAVESDIGPRPTPKAVVDHARNPRSPLHSFFCWDDGVAAERYRIIQARELLRVRVEIINHTIDLSIPAYVRDVDQKPTDQGYIDLVSVRASETKSRETLIRELTALKGHARRIWGLAETMGVDLDVAGIVSAIDRCTQQASRARTPKRAGKRGTPIAPITVVRKARKVGRSARV